MASPMQGKSFLFWSNCNILFFNYICALISDQSPKARNAHLSWEKYLTSDVFKEDWECIHTSIHKDSVNMTVQKNGCKIQLRWYRTPWCRSTILVFHVQLMLEMWLRIRYANIYLEGLSNTSTFLDQILPYNLLSHHNVLDFTPAQFVLHHASPHRRLYLKFLAMYMVSAAKLYVPVIWGSTQALTIQERFSRPYKIAEMEEPISISHNDNPSEFHKDQVLLALLPNYHGIRQTYSHLGIPPNTYTNSSHIRVATVFPTGGRSKGGG